MILDDHGYDVIDVHHHVDTGIGVAEALDVGRKTADAGAGDSSLELKTRLRVMDAQHVRGAVIIAGHSYLRPRGNSDTRVVNDSVAKYRDLEPSRFVAGVGVVEPLYGEAGYAEVTRCRDELGLVGISFHNGMQGLPIDSPLMTRLIGKIGEAGLVPFVHALGNPMETLWQVDSLAKNFPDLTMVILDVFHDVSQVKLLPDVAERRPNLYFDLALSPSFEFIGLPTVRAVGADRFLFGTDMYSWPTMTKPFGQLLPDILESDLSHQAKKAIFSGNITRILGL